MIKKDNSIFLVLYTLTFIGIIVERIFQKGWLDFNLAFTKMTQINSSMITGAARFVSGPLLYTQMAAYFWLSYTFQNYRPRFYYEFIAFINGIAIAALLKMFLREGRPYMYPPSSENVSVTPGECECDYGMPSGHALTIIMLSFLVYKRTEEYLIEYKLADPAPTRVAFALAREPRLRTPRPTWTS